MLCQNNYSAAVKPCCYIPPEIPRDNAGLEGCCSQTQQGRFFGLIPSGKVLLHSKTTIYYSGLTYIDFVIFALDIPCTTPEILRKFPNCIFFS